MEKKIKYVNSAAGATGIFSCMDKYISSLFKKAHAVVLATSIASRHFNN